MYSMHKSKHNTECVHDMISHEGTVHEMCTLLVCMYIRSKVCICV